MFRFYSRIRRLPEISEGDCPDSSVRDFRGRSCTNVENFRHSSPRDHGSFDRSFERGNFTFLLSKKKKKESQRFILERFLFSIDLSTGWWTRVEHDCWNKGTFSSFCERFERRVLEEIVRQENLLGPTHEIRGPGQTIRLERIIQVRN